MTKIHWLGAGMSSIPGIRRLASNKIEICVWNRTFDKAQKSINHVNLPTATAKIFNLDNLEREINNGDIVVSQLSANMHIDIAKLCLQKNAHFATTSYLSQDIRNLNNHVLAKKLIFINEIGLDPGIDHLFTHLLVEDLNKENFSDISVSYKSYCGGIPAEDNNFKYKFSWSPVGVLKALNNTAEFIQNFKEKKISKPYEHISNYKINNEIFEAYPNRNSLPYINEYLFPKAWKIKEFVRGTLRLNGWSNAWKEIFLMLNSNDGDIEKKITNKSNELWSKYKYLKNEEDRVVLWVNLEAEKNNNLIWSKTFQLDEKGSGENTAMAKLVSITLSAVIDLILQGKIKEGVQSAPSNRELIKYIFKVLSENSMTINNSNY
tara:strand:- start:191 stop:1321 length:1131 start_codon:yes stop_codon:yes gene_type:complete